mgnify:CR=1 FL=1
MGLLWSGFGLGRVCHGIGLVWGWFVVEFVCCGVGLSGVGLWVYRFIICPTLTLFRSDALLLRLLFLKNCNCIRLYACLLYVNLFLTVFANFFLKQMAEIGGVLVFSSNERFLYGFYLYLEYYHPWFVHVFITYLKS